MKKLLIIFLVFIKHCVVIKKIQDKKVLESKDIIQEKKHGTRKFQMWTRLKWKTLVLQLKQSLKMKLGNPDYYCEVMRRSNLHQKMRVIRQ